MTRAARRPPPRALRFAPLLGVIAIALALPGLWLDGRLFFAAWLSAWWFWVGIVLGAFTNIWVHRLTGGRWGEAMRPVTLALGRRMPWLLLLGLPLGAGLAQLYPWAADPSGHWAAGMTRPAFVQAWLAPHFVELRLLAYLVVWYLVTRPGSLVRKGASAVALLAHVFVTSLAAMDLLASLVVGWYSTAFGVVVLAGQAMGGAALVTALLAWAWPPAGAGALKPPLWRDLGNLMLMWLLMWAYLAFMQYLIIWSENLPHEIAWYLPRVDTGWRGIAIALVLLQVVVPFFALLMRRLKDVPQRIAWVAALLVATQALNSCWLVLPSVSPHDPLGWWLVPLLTVGIGLLVFGRLPEPETATRFALDPSEARHAAA
jgi:uncharacterized membrane protein YhaH (DUF805 family)